MKRRYKLLFYILLLLAINIVVYLYDYRTEPFMRDNYVLEEASLNVLKEVEEPVIITFYESDNLNPLEQRFSDNIQMIVEAYEENARVPFHIEKINPLDDIELELGATNSGVQAMEMKGEDNTIRKIFLGMIIQKGERTEVLPRLTPRMSIEYLISSSLRKLCEQKRRKIAFVQGHGEASLTQLTDVGKRLLPNYDIEPIVLSQGEDLSHYESMLVIAPSLKYTEDELKCLDAFLDEGKNLFLALDRVEYDDEEEEGYAIDTWLEQWLARKGLLMYSNFIVDNLCGDTRLSEYAPVISFPYFPQIIDFPAHVATQGVSAIVLRYASTIEFTNKEGVFFTPLGKTSEVSGKKELPLRIDVNHEWTKADYLYPEQVVAAVIEGKLGEKGTENSKIVVISDGDLVLGANELRRFENHLFVANIIDWLSDTSGLAALKQKGVMREVKETVDSISTLEKYLNLFLPALLVLLAALFFYFRRKWHIEKLRSANF